MLALSHESVPAQAPADPEKHHHELVQEATCKGDHSQGEDGAARAAGSGSDVHGLFHDSLVIGACGSSEVGQGSDSAVALTQSREDSGSNEESDSTEGVFGPHSPREGPSVGPHVLGLELLGSEGSEKADAGGGAEPIDPLGQFLIDCTSPLRAALLPNPVDGGKQDGGEDGKLTSRSSGRLAAKPTAGWSTMDKVQLVLMKKGDVWAGDSPAVDATAADLQKYRDLYKQPLPDKFVAAVTELVNSTGGHGKKTGHVDLKQAQVAVA